MSQFSEFCNLLIYLSNYTHQYDLPHFPYVYLYYMYTCVCKHICECVCMREWSLHFIRYPQTHTHANTNTSMRVHAHHVKKIPLPEAK